MKTKIELGKSTKNTIKKSVGGSIKWSTQINSSNLLKITWGWGVIREPINNLMIWTIRL